MRTTTQRLAGVALSLASVTGLFVATAPAAEAAAGCANNTYSYSLTTKPCVRYLQRLVNAVYADPVARDVLGSKRVLDPDGKYGTKTESAITHLQEHIVLFKVRNGTILDAKVDGQTGVQTWTFLCQWVPADSLWRAAGCDLLDTPYVESGLM